jgi:hypothetical protein
LVVALQKSLEDETEAWQAYEHVTLATSSGCINCEQHWLDTCTGALYVCQPQVRSVLLLAVLLLVSE